MACSRTAFDAFVSANAESLLRTAHLVTMDEGEAEDLVQECLLVMSQRWRRVGAMDQPLAYARRVLVNLAVRGGTKRSKRRAELDVTAVERAADSSAIELVETRDELWAALRQLTPRQRVPQRPPRRLPPY
jgi:RNA polymerase sigma factor (sigma-70 family)